jgi:hypothetical protein
MHVVGDDLAVVAGGVPMLQLPLIDNGDNLLHGV